MFNISFQGDLGIVRAGKKIGKMNIAVWPSDAKGITNLCIDHSQMLHHKINPKIVNIIINITINYYNKKPPLFEWWSGPE